jgi:hypothetical protein
VDGRSSEARSAQLLTAAAAAPGVQSVKSFFAKAT